MKDKKDSKGFFAKQKHILEKGKVKNIGWFESVPLRIAGRSDGSRGLPRRMENSDWTSAVLSREAHSYKEYCDRIWGMLQIELADRFSRLGYLLDEVKHLEAQAEAAGKHLEEACRSADSEDSASRMHGEERLSESQVRRRRARERSGKLQPFRSAVQNLEAEIKECLKEAITIQNEITEANNNARLVCKRLMDHTRQRIDVYWNSAMCTHPESSKMPVMSSVQMIPDAELVYFTQHRAFLEEAQKTIMYLTKKYDITNEKEEAA